MVELGLILVVACLLDFRVGDPPYRFHPVRMMGWGIERVERFLRRCRWEGRGGGILLVLVMAGATMLAYFVPSRLLFLLHPFLGLLFDLYIVYSCLALGDLLHHLQPVIRALESADLEKARKSVAMVVGRDVRALNEAGVARAAVETLAENFVDGFLSPLFWFLAGWLLSILLGREGMAGPVVFMLLFKVASTLDSMVGYRTPPYRYFGWAGARLDDLMNFIPARLSILFLCLGAGLTRLNVTEGLRAAVKDRRKHDSPNSAHPESFVAGALGLRLGGPTLYTDGMKEKPWLGSGRAEAGPTDIRNAVRLLKSTGWIVVIFDLAVIILVQGAAGGP